MIQHTPRLHYVPPQHKWRKGEKGPSYIDALAFFPRSCSVPVDWWTNGTILKNEHEHVHLQGKLAPFAFHCHCTSVHIGSPSHLACGFLYPNTAHCALVHPTCAPCGRPSLDTRLEGQGCKGVVMALEAGHLLGRRNDCPNSHCPDCGTLGAVVQTAHFGQQWTLPNAHWPWPVAVASSIPWPSQTTHGRLWWPLPTWPLGAQSSWPWPHPLGCSVLGRGAEPLVRTQFPEHPPSLDFGANHLKNGFSTLKNPPSPFFPHITRIVGVVFFGGGQRVRAELEQS